MRAASYYKYIPFVFVGALFAFMPAAPAQAAVVAGVQRGEVIIPAAVPGVPNPPAVVNINPVVPTRAFVVCYNRIGGPTYAPPEADSRFLCRLTGANTLQVQGLGESGEDNIVNWQIVEFEKGVEVQHGLSTHNFRFPGTTNVRIDPVDPSHSFIILGTGGSAEEADAESGANWDAASLVRARLVDGTTLELQSGAFIVPEGQERQEPVAWQVVQFSDATVQRGIAGEYAPGAGGFTQPILFDESFFTAPIGAVDTSRSFPLITTLSSVVTGAEGRYQVMPIVNVFELILERLGDTIPLSVGWEVVELRDGSRVQRGVAQASVGQDSLRVTLSSIADPARSIVILGAKGGARTSEPGFPTLPGQLFWSHLNYDETAWTPFLTDERTLDLTRSGTEAPSSVAWYVVTFDDQGTALPPDTGTLCTPEQQEIFLGEAANESRCDFTDPSLLPEGAASAAPVTIPIVIDNPNEGRTTDVFAHLTIPSGIEPIELESFMSWDAETRVLSVSLGDFEAGEEKQFSLTLSHNPGTCFFYGMVSGNWESGPFCERRGPVVSIIDARQTPPSEIIGEGVRSIGATINDFLNRFRANQTISELARTIGTPLLIALGALGIGTSTATAVSASGALAWNFFEIVRFLLLGFLRFKKHKPWGTVLDATSKKPVAGATVQIIETEFQRVKESQVTDQEGRFGFLVVPGKYYLRVIHSSYEKTETAPFTIESAEQDISMDVSVPPLGAERVIKTMSFRRFLSGAREFLEIINPYLIVVGTLLSIAVALLFPTLLNIGILTLYVVVIIFKLWLRFNSVRSLGTVKDEVVHEPLPLAVVRIFDQKRNWLLSTRVTGAGGRFKFLALPGEYYLTADKEGYESYTSPTLDLTKPGVVAQEIELAPKGGTNAPAK